MKNFFRYGFQFALLGGLLSFTPFTFDSRPAPSGSILVAIAMAMGFLAMFLFNKTTDTAEDRLNPKSLPVKPQYYERIKNIAYIVYAIPLLWLWRHPEVAGVYLVFPGLLGFLYSKSFKLGSRTWRAKNILIVKNLVPAIIWTACTAAPYYFLQHAFTPMILMVHAVSVFAVLLCIDIINDIRDMEGDRVAAVRTLPASFGLWPAKIGLLAIFGAYCAWLYTHLMPSPTILLQDVIVIAMVLGASPKRPYWYFQGIVVLWTAFIIVGMLPPL